MGMRHPQGWLGSTTVEGERPVRGSGWPPEGWALSHTACGSPVRPSWSDIHVGEHAQGDGGALRAWVAVDVDDADREVRVEGAEVLCELSDGEHRLVSLRGSAGQVVRRGGRGFLEGEVAGSMSSTATAFTWNLRCLADGEHVVEEAGDGCCDVTG
jgi:hypothetical protein